MDRDYDNEANGTCAQDETSVQRFGVQSIYLLAMAPGPRLAKMINRGMPLKITVPWLSKYPLGYVDKLLGNVSKVKLKLGKETLDIVSFS